MKTTTKLSGPLTPVPLAEGVDRLSDYDLDAALDAHLFGRAEWCYGRCDWQPRRPGLFVYQCAACGYIDERGPATGPLGNRGHLRNIPHYSVEQIVSAIGQRDDATLMRFAVALYRQINGRSSSRLLFGELLRLIHAIATPRAIAVAALIALGVIDEGGLR